MRPLAREVLAADGRADGEEGARQRRRHARQLADRSQERQADAHILAHVAVLGQHDPLAPVAGLGELVVRAAAVHPLLAVLRVVVGERKVRGAIAQRLANGDALGIERVGDAARDRLGALLVDVPALEMLERRRIHDDQRRVNDGAGVHQRARQGIPARLDRAGEDAVEERDGIALRGAREDAGRQPLGADGDRHLEGPMLAREPRQRAGLGEDRVGAIAGVARASANSIEPKVPGGTNTTWCLQDAARGCAMSGCAVAGAGHTISSAPCTASPMSAVMSAAAPRAGRGSP